LAVTAADVKARARSLGFDLCGVAAVETYRELSFLREWLGRGYAGEMGYLARTAERRSDVRRLLPAARSVIVVGVVYNTDRPYSTERDDADEARIARYAWGDDYHDRIGRRLDALLGWMRGQAEAGFEARAYVDTGPVQERVYAQYAGLGWIGKNTCLINHEIGSWVLLAEIISTAALEPDAPGLDQCGTCTLCLEACPTGALVEPWVLDATRCLAYLTIELKGPVPERMRPDVGAHVFGCDICQEVCPWNQTPTTGRTGEAEWQPRPGLDGPRTADLWRRSDDSLRALLRGSAMKRPGLGGLRRNLAIALGNAASDEARRAIDAPVEAPSLDDPMVAEHVTWARRRLARSSGGAATRDAGRNRMGS
jgi:epoxyqueuosine reductase